MYKTVTMYIVVTLLHYLQLTTNKNKFAKNISVTTVGILIGQASKIPTMH